MSKPLHQVRSCDWCDQLYDISLSDAQTEKRYCSMECEQEHDTEEFDAELTRIADSRMRARDMQMTGRGIA